MKIQNLVLIMFLSLPAFAWAGEPPYCNPDKFSDYEISYSGKKPRRLHVYKIGQVVLAGMAVGTSNANDVAKVAQTYANVSATSNYCTWYYNDGNSAAEKMFTWKDLPKPTGRNYSEMVSRYEDLMGDHFDRAAVNMVSCAVDQGYMGLGCNGQMHRGPSVFAMVLGYAGCSPEHAAQIATNVWGSNGIKLEMRQALAEKGAQIAAENPEQSERFRAALAQ